MTLYYSTDRSSDTITLSSGDSAFVAATGAIGAFSLSGSNPIDGHGWRISVTVSGFVGTMFAGGSTKSGNNNVTVNGGGFVGSIGLLGGSNQIINYGVISGDAQSSGLVSFEAGGASTVVNINTILNAGVIANTFPLGVAYTIVASGGYATHIDNSGTISTASGVAIELNAYDDLIHNTGTIIGGVDLGDGANILDSRNGSIFGTITGGNGGNNIHTGDIDATVTTGAGNDIIHSGAGDDTINAGDGGNVMFGGAGDDVMTGGGGIDSIKGQDGDDALYGGQAQDYLFGGNGSDLLDGGDPGFFAYNMLYGGADGDQYNVHSAYDIVNERDIYEGSGVDSVIVYGAFDFSLSDKTHVKGEVENLVLEGATTLDNIDGTGNKLDNLIYGTDGGANVLSGLAGDDELYGRLGNDTLDGGAGADLLDGGGGTDTATYESSASSVAVALDGSIAATGDAVGDTFVSIEWLRGANVAGAGDTLRGNNVGNSIFGLLGDDSLNGRGGADKLTGGQGSDTLTGEGGNDWFIYNAAGEGGDTVADFASGADIFRFKGSAFAGLTAGTYSSANFVARADHAAQDGNDFFIFQTTDKSLWFDADGNGAGAAVMVADLQAAANMVFSDIDIF